MPPFGGAGHYGSLQGAALEFFRNPEASWDLFVDHYPLISWQLHGGHLPANFMTREHMVEVWHRSESCWTFHRKGAVTRGARWFQIFEQAPAYTPVFAIMAMVLEYIGLHEGWAEDAAHDAAHLVAHAGGLAPTAEMPTALAEAPMPGHAPRPTVRSPNRVADALMAKCETPSTWRTQL